MDRTKANQVGFTQRDVAQNLLISLSGSFQTSPAFWLDSRTGVSYSIITQTPQYRIDPSLQDLENIPVANARPVLRRKSSADLASFTRGAEMAVVSHYDIQTGIDIYGGVEGRDLGGVARDMLPIIDQSRKDLPPGSQISMRGQIQTMNASFAGLLAGLAFSIVLVYLLIVVNFQSWLDPFIILMALARGAGRHRLVPVRHAYHDQRPRVDRRDHVHGRGHREQHSGDQLLQGKAARPERLRRKRRSRRDSRDSGRS